MKPNVGSIMTIVLYAMTHTLQSLQGGCNVLFVVNSGFHRFQGTDESWG